MYRRTIYLNDIIKRKSIFLLGPRQTGKSTLLKTVFPDCRYIDLLEADTFRELSAFPESMRQRLTPADRLIIIDEIQKLPSLLDEVQLLIDRNRDLRFILTGSSARRLKRGSANLLGGRALFYNLHPLTSAEVGHERHLDRINRGGLPSILDSSAAQQDLNAYVGTYLKEEIQAEGLTRSIGNFSRVLHFAAQLNAEQVNYTKIGNDAQVPPRTIRDYFQIFSDTLVGHTLPPWRQGKRKAVATDKFYFFDLGVARNLAQIGTIAPGTSDYGKALEHLIFLELLAYRDYLDQDMTLNFWRTTSQLEVDFLVNGAIAIEVKASGRVGASDLRGLKALAEETTLKRQIVVSHEATGRRIDAVEVMPVADFLVMLWQGRLLSD